MIRFKIWLGRFVGWDKSFIRFLLVILAINVGLFGFAFVESIDLSSRDDCNAACMEDIRVEIERLIANNFPEVDRVVDRAIDENTE